MGSSRGRGDYGSFVMFLCGSGRGWGPLNARTLRLLWSGRRALQHTVASKESLSCLQRKLGLAVLQKALRGFEKQCENVAGHFELGELLELQIGLLSGTT